jgi:hypothetical protein
MKDEKMRWIEINFGYTKELIGFVYYSDAYFRSYIFESIDLMYSYNGFLTEC